MNTSPAHLLAVAHRFSVTLICESKLLSPSQLIFYKTTHKHKSWFVKLEHDGDEDEEFFEDTSIGFKIYRVTPEAIGRTKEVNIPN